MCRLGFLLLQWLCVSILLTNFCYAQWNTYARDFLAATGTNHNLVPASDGGCYVSYEQGNPSQLNLRLFNKYGRQPWRERIRITGELPQQWQSKVVSDEQGGAILSFEDNISLPFTSRLRVQRVTKKAIFCWGQNGVRVSLSENNQGNQALKDDGFGGCVVVWVENDTYRANRVNAAGERAWGDSGVFLSNSIYIDPPKVIRTTGNIFAVLAASQIFYINLSGQVIYSANSTATEVVSDEHGGIILAGRGGSYPLNWQIVAQRKDSTGQNLWPGQFVFVSDNADVNAVINCLTNGSIVYFSWVGKTGTQLTLEMQGVRLDGSRLLQQGSILLGNDPILERTVGIIPSLGMQTIFCWSNMQGAYGKGTYAQMFDTAGQKIWQPHERIVKKSGLANKKAVPDGNGGFYVSGTINEFTILLNHFSDEGFIEQDTATTTISGHQVSGGAFRLFQNYPNPFNPSTEISFTLPERLAVSLSIYNQLGQQVAALLNGEKEAGSHTVTWHAGSLVSGVYFYEIKTGKYRAVKKLLLLK
ncbi:MAG: T9SS type A sorting domain-containing protein [Ignavibacteriales bacterium]|nr:T9SS type A sorting domain-containing protein [Ignavibacteriales bacterium]